MHRPLATILFLALNFSTQFASATNLCADWALSGSSESVTTIFTHQKIEGVYKRLTRSDFLTLDRDIRLMVEELSLRNEISFPGFNYPESMLAALKLKMGETASDEKILAILYDNNTSKENSGNYRELLVVLRNGKVFYFRSNGRITFLNNSYHGRDKQHTKKYFATYLENGQAKAVDQGELMLSTLPQEFKISRTMSETERQNWVNGVPFLSEKFGHKVHFAYHYFPFSKNAKTYTFKLTRDELIEYYRRNELEINTYDLNQDMTLSALGVEFELVFVGESAIKKIAPIMRDSLRDQEL